MSDLRIPAGYVRRAHGITGDVVVRKTLQDSDQRFVVGEAVTTDEAEPRTLHVEAVRPHQGDLVVRFSGIDDRAQADTLRGTQFLIDRADRRTLEPGEWWPEDLEGCTVVDLDGEHVGDLVEVICGAAQDRLVIVRPDGARGEVPFVEALVPRVEPDARRVVVDLPEGLFS